MHRIFKKNIKTNSTDVREMNPHLVWVSMKNIKLSLVKKEQKQKKIHHKKTKQDDKIQVDPMLTKNVLLNRERI